jgi:hypothetical protein
MPNNELTEEQRRALALIAAAFGGIDEAAVLAARERIRALIEQIAVTFEEERRRTEPQIRQVAKILFDIAVAELMTKGNDNVVQ